LFEEYLIKMKNKHKMDNHHAETWRGKTGSDTESKKVYLHDFVSRSIQFLKVSFIFMKRQG